ncbi:MAG: hypothetical protein U0W24_21035 [Bacteroidales bacterium]
MNRWLIVILIVFVVLIGIGIAYDMGLFDNITFGGLSTLFAALAAPYLMVKNWLFGNKEIKQFQDKYEHMKVEEGVHRTDTDIQIKAKEKRIAELDKEIQLLDAKLQVLEMKKSKVDQYVNSMTVDQTKKEVQNLFGD